MNAFLHPCPSCQRHVRTDEAACPFCAVNLQGAFAGVAPPRLPPRRMSRAALLALGTMVSATPLTACGGEAEDDSTMNTGGSGADMATGGAENMGTGGDGTTQPVYGAVPTGGAENMGTGGTVYGTVPTGGAENMGTGGDGTGGMGGADNMGTGGDGVVQPVYGTVPTGGVGGLDDGTGGDTAQPEYGAFPTGNGGGN